MRGDFWCEHYKRADSLPFITLCATRGITPSLLLSISSLRNSFLLSCRGKSLPFTLRLAILTFNPSRWGRAWRGDFVKVDELVRYRRAFFEVNLARFLKANPALNLALSRPSLFSTNTILQTVISSCRTCLWTRSSGRAFRDPSANMLVLTLKMQRCRQLTTKLREAFKCDVYLLVAEIENNLCVGTRLHLI